MNAQWHFNPRRPCDRMRDSANDAFFTAESLENLSEALVREGIQNSLDAAQRAELTRALQQVSGKRVTVQAREDASLLGGVVAKVGDRIYDGSLRTQLRALRDELSKF